MQNDYYRIHCPACSATIDPFYSVKFSISQFVKVASFMVEAGQGKGSAQNLVVDCENLKILTDCEYLWDMSVGEIAACFNNEDLFELKGETIIQRFGKEVLEAYRTLPEGSQILSLEVYALIDMIYHKISKPRLKRAKRPLKPTGKERQEIYSILKYAKSGRVLFRLAMEIETGLDDRQRFLPVGIRSSHNGLSYKTRRCSFCGEPLSQFAGRYEEKMIAVLGNETGGKSVFLKALAKEATGKGKGILSKCVLNPGINLSEPSLTTEMASCPNISLLLSPVSSEKKYIYTFVDIMDERFYAVPREAVDVHRMWSNTAVMRCADAVLLCVGSDMLFSSGDSGAGLLTALGNNTAQVIQTHLHRREREIAVGVVITETSSSIKAACGSDFQTAFEKVRLAPESLLKEQCFLYQKYIAHRDALDRLIMKYGGKKADEMILTLCLRLNMRGMAWHLASASNGEGDADFGEALLWLMACMGMVPSAEIAGDTAELQKLPLKGETFNRLHEIITIRREAIPIMGKEK